MRNQVLEFNSGSIKKLIIFEDWIEFFQANCAKSRVQLKTIWEFNGQLRVKYHKLEARDQNKKGAEI